MLQNLGTGLHLIEYLDQTKQQPTEAPPPKPLPAHTATTSAAIKAINDCSAHRVLVEAVEV